MTDALDEIRRCQEMLKIAYIPAAPRGILLHPQVKSGLWRQWDTKGQLWVWVNKGWFVRSVKKCVPDAKIGGTQMMATWGIPTYDRSET